MSLKDFLSALKTKGVLVTIEDTDDNEVCKIYAEGVTALDDTIEGMTVSKWEVTASKALTVVVVEPVTP